MIVEVVVRRRIVTEGVIKKDIAAEIGLVRDGERRCEEEGEEED